MTETLSTYSDMIGLLGVILILVAYFLLQIRRLRLQQFAYSFLNFIGAVLILISLWYHWNLASVVIEIAWGLISLYGMYQNRRRI